MLCYPRVLSMKIQRFDWPFLFLCVALNNRANFIWLLGPTCLVSRDNDRKLERVIRNSEAFLKSDTENVKTSQASELNTSASSSASLTLMQNKRQPIQLLAQNQGQDQNNICLFKKHYL